MIAVSSSGKSFGALASYLANGRTGEERDRIAWATSRNLPTDDPELAATFMQATASRSDRVEKPVYHLALSFDPGDRVDRAAMERVADRVLERLGLKDHQAMIVAHGDRDHPHVHVFVNRVHPETGLAWERWKDQPVIQEVLRGEEIALGLRQVPRSLESHRQRDHETPELFPAIERSAGTQKRESPERERPEPRSRIEQVKRDLEMYERVAALSRELYTARLEADAARVRALQLESAFERARSAEEAFVRALRPVYRDPDAAKRAFAGRLVGEGLTEATRALRERPDQLGLLNTEERRVALGLVRRADEGAARAAAPEAARLGAAAVEAERAAWIVVLETRARRLEETFDRQLRTVYEHPAAARERFESLARQLGIERASEALSTRPREFGELLHAHRERDENNLAAVVRTVARAGLEAARAREDARAASEQPHLGRIDWEHFTSERRSTRDHLDRAAARERALREDLNRRPRAHELQHRIARTIDLLLPHEARRLKMAVTAPHIALAATLKSAAREVLLGPDQERSR